MKKIDLVTGKIVESFFIDNSARKNRTRLRNRKGKWKENRNNR